MELKELLTKISQKEAEAAIFPEDANPNVRQGVEAMVRNAKADLETLRKQYKESVLNAIRVIGVKGETSEQFAQIARETTGSVVLNFNSIVDRITKSLLSQALGDRYTTNAHFALVGELSRIRLEYDMVRLPSPMVSPNDPVYGYPIVDAVPLIIEKNYGTSLQSAVSRRDACQAALDARFSGAKLPVILYNVKGDVDSNLLPNLIMTLESNDTPTEISVKKKLSQAKKLLTDTKDSKLADEATGEQV